MPTTYESMVKLARDFIHEHPWNKQIIDFDAARWLSDHGVSDEELNDPAFLRVFFRMIRVDYQEMAQATIDTHIKTLVENVIRMRRKIGGVA
jgi:hypothetical protein